MNSKPDSALRPDLYLNNSTDIHKIAPNLNQSQQDQIKIKSSLTSSFILYLVSLLFYYIPIIVNSLPILFFVVCSTELWLPFVSLWVIPPLFKSMCKLVSESKFGRQRIAIRGQSIWPNRDSLFCKVNMARDYFMSCICMVSSIWDLCM